MEYWNSGIRGRLGAPRFPSFQYSSIPSFHSPRRSRHMQRRSRRILTVLGIVVVTLAATYAILLARATARLRRAYAALEADGRPLQAAEILPPKVPDANNAAVLYQSAVLLLKGQPAGDKSLYERLTGRLWDRSGEAGEEPVDRPGGRGRRPGAHRGRDPPAGVPVRARSRPYPGGHRRAPFGGHEESELPS